MAKAPRAVAICGTAMTSARQVNKEAEEVERWCLSGCFKFVDKVDRFYEVHTRAWNLRRAGPKYFEYAHFLQQLEVPVYQLESQMDPTFKNSLPIPLGKLNKYFFPNGMRPYYSSTVAYMLAMAVWEKVDEIKLYGVDMSSKMEYSHQRAGCEYFLGAAVAQGIKVDIPKSSPILKSPMYGRKWDHKVNQDALMERIGKLKTEEQRQVEALVSTRSKISECEYWIGEETGLERTETDVPEGAPVIMASRDGKAKKSGQVA